MDVLVMDEEVPVLSRVSGSLRLFSLYLIPVDGSEGCTMI